jgi:quinol monooxygenase YgiN
MRDRITLVVRFRIVASAREEFLAKLEEIFSHIVKEDTFLQASLVQDIRDPESILNFEVWDETPESFMKEQLSKPYRADFEKMIADLKIERAPAWYSTIGNWTRA